MINKVIELNEEEITIIAGGFGGRISISLPVSPPPRPVSSCLGCYKPAK